MASSNRPKDKIIVTPERRLLLEWDAYFERLDSRALSAEERLDDIEAISNNVVIASGSLSGAQVDITNIPATYAYLSLLVSNISHNDAGTQRPIVQASTDNGASFLTSAYRNTAVNTAGSITLTAPLTSSMVSEIAARAAAEAWTYTLHIFGYQGGTFAHYQCGIDWVGNAHYLMSGTFFNSNAINALRIAFTGGSIDGGTYVLYGRR